jgi:hypothetical protein
MILSSGREIHRRSDSLVQLKLALCWSDRKLYARAIALFYFIFRELEALLASTSGLKASPLVHGLILPTLARTAVRQSSFAVIFGIQ